MHDRSDNLETRVDYHFEDPEHLARALTHASIADDPLDSNETLEFLGDAVIDLVVAEELFGHEDGLTEGDMTAAKSVVVSRQTLAKVGRQLRLQDELRVGPGLQRRGGRYPESLLANAYEALVGAIFTDGSYSDAQRFVLHTLGPHLEKTLLKQHEPDFKSVLQRLVQAEGSMPPTYKIVRRTGPEHKPEFSAAALIDGQQEGTGSGRSKKAAEQKAAEAALDRLYPQWREKEEISAE